MSNATSLNAHVRSVDEVVNDLDSDQINGLTEPESAVRQAHYGPNKLPTQKSTTALERLWAQINSILIYILIVGAIISFVFEHLIDGILIFVVVAINVSSGYLMESKAENATEVLKNMLSPNAQVIREGDKRTLEAVGLTLGDIFLLQPGDIVPADGRVIRCSDLSVLEATLTGESHPILKNTQHTTHSNAPLAVRKCMVYSGTQVLKGTATCIVTAIGAECEIGKISGLLKDIEEVKTPLIRQLEKFGLILSVIIICLALAAFGIAVARNYPIDGALGLAIGIAVAAIPEGLPACITVTFAIGVRHMAKKNAIVKSLPAVETLGSVSVICSDKTGTLTINKMTVMTICATNHTLEFNEDGIVVNVVSAADEECAPSSRSGSKKEGGGSRKSESRPHVSRDEVVGLLLPGILCNDGSVLTADTPYREGSEKASKRREVIRSKDNQSFSISEEVQRDLSKDFLSFCRRDSEEEEERKDERVLQPTGAASAGEDGAVESGSGAVELVALAGEFTIQGDPTETCVLALGVHLTSAVEVRAFKRGNVRLAEIPFDSATKYMATLHTIDQTTLAKLQLATSAETSATAGSAGKGTRQPRTTATGTDARVKVVCVKGAPSKIIPFCAPPPSDPRSAEWSKRWMQKASSVASRGMRVLAFAYKVVPADYQFTGHLEPHSGFSLTAIVGIVDPPRPEAIVAIKQAHDAGITVKMITGDHPVTAVAIGKMMGIPPTNQPLQPTDLEAGRGDHDGAITGTDLDHYIVSSMETFDEVVVSHNIFARTTPEHKLRILQSLQRQGFVCSMTGDGVNDAPALKAANIGVAMGITGTEVAKDAANVVLTDDNFATIVEAIRIGRCTYNNLVKIITFVLPANGGQAFSIIAALIIGVQVPITALQVLWVNMITSVTLGLVLAFDQPDSDILNQKPRRPNKQLFGRFLTWRLVFVTTVLTVAVLGIYQWERHRFSDVARLRAVAVNTLAVAQIMYIFNCRNLRRNTNLKETFGGNNLLYAGIAVVIALQVLFTYAPPLQYVFQTANLDGTSWGKIILFAVGIFLLVELEKYIGWKRLARRARVAHRKRTMVTVVV